MPRKQSANSLKGNKTPLKNCVTTELNRYFDLLDGQEPSNLYKMVIGETEQALLSVVLQQTDGNQTRAAGHLGISRGTLRKKLKEYNLE